MRTRSALPDLLCRTGKTHHAVVSAEQATAVTVTGRHAFLPSDEWRTLRVHWHGYLTRQARGVERELNNRYQRLAATPDAVLHTPEEAAEWIDSLIRAHGEHREVWAAGDNRWVAIGDKEDRSHLYYENMLVTARGASLYTDIYSESEALELFLEAVTQHDCAEH